jgi:hypothetical protein
LKTKELKNKFASYYIFVTYLQHQTTPNKMQVHEIILQQLGGNKFLAMTGSKNLTYSSVENNYLQMRLTRNMSGANFLKITLNASDTYTLKFFKVTIKDYMPIISKEQTFEDIYCDQLQEIFTKVTGLYTKLF